MSAVRKTRLRANYPRIAISGMASIVLATVLMVPTQAGADDTQAFVDATVAAVAAATPTEPNADLTPVPLADNGSAFVAATGDGSLSVPDQSSVPLTLATAGNSVDITLPAVDVASGILNSDSNAVVYPENGQDTTVTVQAFDTGAQLSTVLSSQTAPEGQTYDVDVPTGGSLVQLGDGAIAITDASGNAIGYLGGAWARDANGTEVPTHYDINGSSITQVVDHQDGNFAYPIVADPYFFKDLIYSATWAWTPRSGSIGAGWTLQVTPTKWARLQAFSGLAASYYVGSLGWKELFSKYKNQGLNRNLGAMRDQYICHQQVVALRSPRKPTWNLDEWRQNLSYYNTVKASCNPPRSDTYAY